MRKHWVELTQVPLTQVPSLAARGTADDNSHVEGGHIKLCPMACAKVEANDDAELEVRIPCAIIN